MKKICAMFAIVAMTGCVVPIPVPAPTGAATATRDTVLATSPIATPGFTRTLNAYRKTQGRTEVRQSAILTRAATLHAQDMTARGYFSHRSPGGPNGDNLRDRARSAGCAVRSAAENIARGRNTPQAAFTQWRNSAGHRANMLGRPYTVYGLGRSGDMWVLMLSTGC